MECHIKIDSLNDTPLPPELSFDDLLLDESPVKKGNSSNMMDDPLDFDEEDEKTGPPGDQTLHTPGQKRTKPPPPAALAVTATTLATAAEVAISMTATKTKYERPMLQTTAIITKTATTPPASVASAVANSPKLVTAAKATPHVLLNSKNILPKTTSNKIIKIAPKSLSSTTATTAATIPQATTTVTSTSVASLAGKAVKTSNGQIYYIQKKSNVLPAVRLQQAGTTSTGTSVTTTSGQSIAAVTVAAAATTTATATTVTTNASGNKTVAIQVIRTADGSLMPVKGAAASTLAAAAAASGKKIISNVGGQVVIKTPLRAVSGIATATTNDATGKTVKLQRITTTSATTATTATSGTAAAGVTADNSSNIVPVTKTGGKIIVHSASGKQIVVSNQNLIKLSPKPTTQQTIGSTTGAGITTVTAGTASSAAGKMLQLSGKPMQYVRVLPNSKLGNNSNVNVTATSAAATTTANSSATSPTTSNATATTKSAIRILNPLPPQKFTVVRPSAATKLVLTQSPKKDGGGVTFSPVTSKVQKTIVTLPTQPRTVDDGKNSPTTTPTSSGGSNNNNPRQSLIRHNNNNNNNNSSATTSIYTSLIRKPKISEINTEIKRITSTTSGNEHFVRNSSGIGGPSEIKRNTSGNNIVVVSRSSNLPPLQPRLSLNSMMQGTHTNSYSNSNTNQQPKKLYSVLKNSNTSSSSSSGATFAANLQEQTFQFKRQSLTSASSSSLLRNSGNSNSNAAYSNYNNNNNNASSSANTNKFIPMKIKEEPIDSNDMKPSLLDDGVLRRKHCNCSKSQCLKLYCDCFANGEFCQDCTCKDCFNNLQYEDERQRAIKNCLERNPSAFKPKITTSRDSGDMRLHNKGCNCKRSGCLKNYCECYEAKIPCSSNCKCVGCRNIEERPDLDMDPIDPKILATIANASGGAAAQIGQKRSYDKANSKMIIGGAAGGVNDKMLKEAAKACTLNDFISGSGSSTSITGSNSTTVGGGGAIGGGQPAEKQQCNFITQEVVDATIQCMLSQADECEKNGLPAYQTEKMVMEEMGRCLVEIIDFSIRNTDASFSQE